MSLHVYGHSCGVRFLPGLANICFATIHVAVHWHCPQLTKATPVSKFSQSIGPHLRRWTIFLDISPFWILSFIKNYRIHLRLARLAQEALPISSSFIALRVSCRNSFFLTVYPCACIKYEAHNIRGGHRPPWWVLLLLSFLHLLYVFGKSPSQPPCQKSSLHL